MPSVGPCSFKGFLHSYHSKRSPKNRCEKRLHTQANSREHPLGREYPLPVHIYLWRPRIDSVIAVVDNYERHRYQDYGDTVATMTSKFRMLP